MTEANVPFLNNPSFPECAKVIIAVPSGYTENPNGVRVPAGAETAVGNPEMAPSLSSTTSTVPGIGSVLRVTSNVLSSTSPTWAVLPFGGRPPPTSTNPVVPSNAPTWSPSRINESTLAAPATYM